jgi:Tfp pilus assembly protein PilW
VLVNASNLRQDGGFTLIETLVAMIAGVVVTGAVLEIFMVSLHQTSRLTDYVQATQLGRSAMTHIVDELHSACISREFAPIQEKSNANELIFRNGYSEEAFLPNAKEAETKEASLTQKKGAGVFEHQIVWSKSAGTLTDYIYKTTSGEWPTYVFPEVTSTHANATPTTGIQLASNVTEASGSTPIFKYYMYGEAASGSSSTAESTLTEEKPPTSGFTAEEAKKVAAVLVSFGTAPIDGQTALSRRAEFSNQIIFSFSTPSSETTIKDGPCQ